jgi:hypothetical protein
MQLVTGQQNRFLANKHPPRSGEIESSEGILKWMLLCCCTVLCRLRDKAGAELIGAAGARRVSANT